MVVSAKTITSRGRGRKDFSDSVELSVAPMIRRHQTRLAYDGKTSVSSIDPGESATIALYFTKAYRGSTIQLRNIKLTINENHLIKGHFAHANIDKLTLGIVHKLDDYGVQYGYGKCYFDIRQGISLQLAKDAETSIYQPNYLKDCFVLYLENPTDKVLKNVVMRHVAYGMMDKYPWW